MAGLTIDGPGVRRVSVELALSAAPLVRVEVAELPSDTWVKAAANAETATVNLPGQALALNLLGSEPLAEQGGWVVTGLAATEATHAVAFLLQPRHDQPLQCPVLVDQRRADSQDTPVATLGRLLGNHLGDVASAGQLDAVLPPGAALAVPAPTRGGELLDTLVDLLAGVGVVGWSVVDKRDRPLRLVEANQPLPLEGDWRPAPAHRVAMPHALAPAGWARTLRLNRPVELADAGRLGQLIQVATTDGYPLSAADAAAPLLASGTPNGLPLACCVVRWRDRAYLTSAVRITWEGGTRVTFQVELLPIEASRPRRAGDSFRLDGRFDRWLREEDGQTFACVLPAGGWGMLDDQGRPDPARPLVAHVLTPSAGDADHAGFYVRHQKPEDAVLRVEPGRIPTVQGRVQLFNAILDKGADLALQARRIVLTNAARGQEAEKGDSLRLDAAEDEVVLHSAAKAASVQLAKSVVRITAKESLEALENLHVDAGKAKVAGDVSIAGDLDVGQA